MSRWSGPCAPPRTSGPSTPRVAPAWKAFVKSAPSFARPVDIRRIEIEVPTGAKLVEAHIIDEHHRRCLGCADGVVLDGIGVSAALQATRRSARAGQASGASASGLLVRCGGGIEPAFVIVNERDQGLSSRTARSVVEILKRTPLRRQIQ